MRLAVLTHEQTGEQVLIRFDAIGDPHENGAAFVSGNRGDPPLAGLRGGNRALDVRNACVRNGIDELSGGGISNLGDAAVGRRRPPSVYQHLHGRDLHEQEFRTSSSKTQGSQTARLGFGDTSIGRRIFHTPQRFVLQRLGYARGKT